CAANRTAHVPLDFELYLPQQWLDDEERRNEARIPSDQVFKTKPDLALDMIGRAIADEIPGDIVLADAAYGTSSGFRDVLRSYGLDFAVAVNATTGVWLLDAKERRRGAAIGVQKLGIEFGLQSFRRVTWRTGTRGKLASRFCFRRVKPAHDDGSEPKDREAL